MNRILFCTTSSGFNNAIRIPFRNIDKSLKKKNNLRSRTFVGPISSWCDIFYNIYHVAHDASFFKTLTLVYLRNYSLSFEPISELETTLNIFGFPSSVSTYLRCRPTTFARSDLSERRVHFPIPNGRYFLSFSRVTGRFRVRGRCFLLSYIGPSHHAITLSLMLLQYS